MGAKLSEKEIDPIRRRYLEALRDAVNRLDLSSVDLKKVSTRFGGNDKKTVRETLESEARRLLMDKLTKGRLGGYSPRGAAAGAIYVVLNGGALEGGYFDRARREEGVVTQEMVARAAGCSEPGQ